MKSPLGSETIMGSKKAKESNQLQTPAMFQVKRRMTQRMESRAPRAALQPFENCFQKLGLAACAWLEFDRSLMSPQPDKGSEILDFQGEANAVEPFGRL